MKKILLIITLFICSHSFAQTKIMDSVKVFYDKDGNKEIKKYYSINKTSTGPLVANKPKRKK